MYYEGDTFPVGANPAEGPRNAERMRAALRTFLSSVGGEPAAWADPATAREYRIGTHATASKWHHEGTRYAVPLSYSPATCDDMNWQPIETASRDRSLWTFNGEQWGNQIGRRQGICTTLQHGIRSPRFSGNIDAWILQQVGRRNVGQSMRQNAAA